jgi:quinol monooxygenase YgiN
MFLVLGSVTLQEGKLDAALALSREHVARSLREPGCIEHGVYTDPENPARLRFIEKWADAAALRAHFQVPASRAFAKALKAMAAHPPSIEIFDALTASVG